MDSRGEGRAKGSLTIIRWYHRLSLYLTFPSYETFAQTDTYSHELQSHETNTERVFFLASTFIKHRENSCYFKFLCELCATIGWSYRVRASSYSAKSSQSLLCVPCIWPISLPLLPRLLTSDYYIIVLRRDTISPFSVFETAAKFRALDSR